MGLGYHIRPSSTTTEPWDGGQAPHTTWPSAGQCLLLRFLLQDSHFIIPLDISARRPGLVSFLPVVLAGGV